MWRLGPLVVVLAGLLAACGQAAGTTPVVAGGGGPADLSTAAAEEFGRAACTGPGLPVGAAFGGEGVTLEEFYVVPRGDLLQWVLEVDASLTGYPSSVAFLPLDQQEVLATGSPDERLALCYFAAAEYFAVPTAPGAPLARWSSVIVAPDGRAVHLRYLRSEELPADRAPDGAVRYTP